MGTTQQLKMVVNASRNLALMSMQCKEKNNHKHEKEVAFHYNALVMVDSLSMVKSQHDNIFQMFNVDIQLITNQQYMACSYNIE